MNGLNKNGRVIGELDSRSLEMSSFMQLDTSDTISQFKVVSSLLEKFNLSGLYPVVTKMYIAKDVHRDKIQIL